LANQDSDRTNDTGRIEARVRITGAAPHNAYPTDRFRLGANATTPTSDLLHDCELTDQPTSYTAFITAFLKSLPLEAKGFSFCAEVTAMTRKSGIDILEIPIRYSKRSVVEGKKIR